jgi:hypothetical protein
MAKKILTINRDIWKTPTEICKEYNDTLTTQIISNAIKRGKIRAWRPEGLQITLVRLSDVTSIYGVTEKK